MLFILLCTLYTSLGAQKLAYDSILSLELPFQEKHQAVLAILEKGDSLEIAGCLHEYAKYCYRNGDLLKAIAIAQRAVVIKAALGTDQSLKGSLFNLAFFHQKNNDYESAIEVLKDITAIAPVDRYHAKAYASMGTNYANTGDYHNALLCQNKATNIFNDIQDLRGLYKNYMDLSLTYATLDRAKYAQEILYVLETIDSLGAFIPIDGRDQIIIEQRRGGVLDELKAFKKGISSYNTALNLARDLKDTTLLALTLNNLAITELKAGLMQQARHHLQEGLSLSAKSNDKARVYNNLGDWFQKQNLWDSAYDAYSRSVALYMTGQPNLTLNEVTNVDLQNTPFKIELFKSLVSLADHLWLRMEAGSERGNWQEYLVTIQLADQLLDLLRAQSNERLSKLFWRSQAADICMKGVKAAYQLRQYDLAYYFMERNKAILLLENLNMRNAQLTAGLPVDLINRQTALYNQVVHAQLRFHEQQNQETEQILNGFNLAYLNYLDSLKRHYPIYAKYLNELPILDYREHRKVVVNAVTNTYHFIFDDEDCFALLSTADTSMLVKIDAEVLQPMLDQFLNWTIDPINTEEELSAYAGISHQLYQILVGPIAKHLRKESKLIISPDYKLHNLSFDALNTSANPDSLKHSYLVNMHEISYAYSFSHLLTAKHSSGPGQYNIVAPGRFIDKTLPELPGSVLEGQEIADITGSVFLSDSLSTKKKVIELIQHSSVFHLATHASADKEFASLNTYDEELTLQELYGLPNQIDLVVLSACGTSRGNYAIGEGMISLARGFFFSGASTVVSTLNNINDGTSRMLMVNFYQNLNEGQTKSAALRNAKLDYLRSSSGSAISPCYWSSFVLIGDGGELVDSGNDIDYFMPVIVVGIILMLIMFFQGRRKKR